MGGVFGRGTAGQVGPAAELSAVREAATLGWRDLAAAAVDFAFQTDQAGRFVFAASSPAFGWPRETLVGQSSRLLLADPKCPDPFRPATPMIREPFGLRRPDGSILRLELTSEVLYDAAGRISGARGVGVALSPPSQAGERTLETLRRTRALDEIFAHLRTAKLAPDAMDGLLDGLVAALQARGAAVIDLPHDEPAATFLRSVGDEREAVLATGLALLDAGGNQMRGPGGHPVLICPTDTKFGGRAVLIVWRTPDAPVWTEEDWLLASSVATLVRIMLEHSAMQRALAAQARSDSLTKLLTRGAFAEDLTRRIARLEHEGVSGTLLCLDLDGLGRLNEAFGYETGDAALLRMADMLRGIVRPYDLIARSCSDEFALWLDGSDELTAAERAEMLRVAVPNALAELVPGGDTGLTVSIGIACRQPGGDGDVGALMRRADRALQHVKHNGGGHWRVSHEAAGV